jgi:DHA1 family bicyclomycin/chloramphenicol resistance-like MFS transporter
MSGGAMSWCGATKTEPAEDFPPMQVTPVKATLGFTLLLGLLTAVGPVSTDMYLPAFPVMEADLAGGRGAAQITLAAWFAGLSLGQLTQGSLADRFGRRGPLLLGTFIYTLASIGCAIAPDISTFSVLRSIAAFGGSASMVIPRAMVRDVAEGHRAATLMSRLILVMGAVPILAPALGGAVLAIASWRVIFWAASAYGLLCLTLVFCYLPDTLPRNRRLLLSAGEIAGRYVAIGRERSFVAYALQSGLGMASMFVYLGGSPTIFIDQYHVSPTQFGMLFGLNAGGFIAAAQLTPRLLPYIGANALLHNAERFLLAAVLLLNLAAFSGFGGVLGLLVPLFLCIGGLGAMLPTAMMGSLTRHAAHAGSASALLGTWQYALAALAGASIGVAGDGTPRPMALLMLCCILGSLIADYCRPTL